MPIYEFYCSDCHTVFNFYARRVDTRTRPACPKCGRPELERRVSLFAISRGRKDGEQDDFPDIDEDRLEQAMGALAADAEGIDEDNPRQIGRFMRKLYDATGLKLGPGMEEAIRRMERGEDPDRIEEELGPVLEEEDPLAPTPGSGVVKRLRRRFLPPAVDETLYEL